MPPRSGLRATRDLALALVAITVVAAVGSAAAVVVGSRPGRSSPSARAPAGRGAPAADGPAGLTARNTRADESAAGAPPAVDPSSTAVATWLRRLHGGDRAARGDALVRLRTLGPEAASAAAEVVRVFAEGDSGLDLLAARTLAAMGPAAFPAIEAGLSDADPRVRAGALATTARLEAPTSRMLDALRAGLSDPDDRVRAAAAAAWGSRPAEAGAVADALAARLDDGSPDVRAAAAGALGRLHATPEVAVPRLADVVTRAGEPEASRLEAIWALGRYGPDARAAAAALADAAEHGTPAARREALRVLAALGDGGADAVPALLRVADRGGALERSAALTSLAAIDPRRPEVARRLAQGVVEGDDAAAAALGGLVEAGDPGIEALRALAGTPEGAAAIGAATLGAAREEAGAPRRRAIERLLAEPSDDLAALALRSLAALGADAGDGIDAVVREMGRAPARRLPAYADALGAIGVRSPAAADALVAQAASADVAARRAAVRALGTVGVESPAVRLALERAAEDPDAETAAAARAAVKRLRPNSGAVPGAK